VEENAAAAKALEHQSHGMNERVSFFRFEHGATRRSETPHSAGAASLSRATAANAATAQNRLAVGSR